MKPVSSEREAGCRVKLGQPGLGSSGRNSRAKGRPQVPGFSIVEAIGGLVVSALVMGALTYGMSGLFSQQTHPTVTYNGQTYTQAPSFDDFHQAIDLHAAFSNAVDAADNMIVLGGTRSHPAFDPTGPSSALAESFLDTSLAAAAGSDGFQAFSSWDQRQINSSQFAAYLTTHPDPADFTILTVNGLSLITSITQQRRYTVAINGQNVVLYEVTHQSIDWSSGSPVLTPNAVTGTTPTYAYRFYYGAAEDLWSMPPGVTHYWYRADSTWDRDQEGPARVVFADPYALSGQDSGSAITPVSRFVYFLPQLR
jgi:hypothetical protein